MGVAWVLVGSAGAIYWKGAELRKRSLFAQKLAATEGHPAAAGVLP